MNDSSLDDRPIAHHYGWMPVHYVTLVVVVVGLVLLIPLPSNIGIPLITMLLVFYNTALLFYTLKSLRRVEERLEALTKKNE